MDPFEAFEAKVEPYAAGGESDPAAEFLAREQAELDKIENNDFANDFTTFESNFTSVSTTQQDDFALVQPVAQQASAAQLADARSLSQDLYSAIESVDRQTQEPEKIRRWRDEQKLRIEQKDADEERRKQDLRENAKRELEEWYKNRQEQLIKTKENNRALSETEQHQKKINGALVNGASDSKTVDWERVAKHCEFNPKANKNVRDVTRFRSLLLQLKQQPLIR